MSVTQQDIADNLNISRSLVGRALCGHPEVAESTRQQIEAAARELGYNSNSNHGARQLISRRYGRRVKTNTLAVVFATMGSAPRRIPFFTSLMDGIEAAGEALDLDICACLVRTAELPRLIQTHSVDGVIMMGDVPQHIERTLHRWLTLEERFGSVNRHVENLRNILPAILDVQCLRVVSGAVAHWARGIHTREKQQLDDDEALAGTSLTSTFGDIERESTGVVAARTCLFCRRKQLSDLVEESRVGRKVRARRATDRSLIDVYKSFDRLGASHHPAAARDHWVVLQRRANLVSG